MPFAIGTSVTFPTGNGDEFTIGTVKSFENGKYEVEVEDGKIVNVEEGDAKEFKIQMQNRGMFDIFK
ncbi:hypothetical protein BJY04DRAFT_223336 [Aspergillus karnatakaensis]|uniref:uncharacterized protein n=1 Tax=Aspergillus karnatakaensis TaxID=1810916 RepID=UPI003CCE194F